MWIFAPWDCSEITSHLFTIQAVAFRFQLTDVSAPLHLPSIAKDKITTARPVEKRFLFLPGNKNQVLLRVVGMNQKDEQEKKALYLCGYILQVKTWEKWYEEWEMQLQTGTLKTRQMPTDKVGWFI